MRIWQKISFGLVVVLAAFSSVSPGQDEGPKKDVGETVAKPRKKDAPDTETDNVSAEDTMPQAYELLTIKVAQKYFFDRNFGGALEGIRLERVDPLRIPAQFGQDLATATINPKQGMDARINTFEQPFGGVMAGAAIFLRGRDHS